MKSVFVKLGRPGSYQARLPAQEFVTCYSGNPIYTFSSTPFTSKAGVMGSG